MKEGPDIARVASLIGNPARANILTALMRGMALTASELADEAGVTLQTASSHLSRLEQGGLIRSRKQGRNKYFSLAGDDIVRLVESLMGVAAALPHSRSRRGPKDPALRKARVCYNHLAGGMGVQVFDSLTFRELLRTEGEILGLSEAGREFVIDFGIDVERIIAGRTPLCRECLDWSERRSHLAGCLGRAFFARFQELHWAKRENGSRVVRFSPSGEKEFAKTFPPPADLSLSR